MSLSWLTRSSIRSTRIPGGRFGVLSANIADAAFARPGIYEALEERGVKYAIRIPSNDNLERDIAELVPRPVGRPQQKALGGIQGISVPGSRMEDGTQGGGEDRASSGRVVPASRIHCDELDSAKSGGGAVLQ